MNRNWYAAFLLAVLIFLLYIAGRYVDNNTQTLTRELDVAYNLAVSGEYEQAKQAFQKAAQRSEENSPVWMLLIRRSLVDQLNQTLATIPSYVSAENLADLAVETARARTQAQQIRESFFSWF